MNNIISNIFFYTAFLFFLIMLQQVIEKQKKTVNITTTKEYLEYLNLFYISNKSFTLFSFILYILLYTMPFFYYRLSNLGVSLQISSIVPNIYIFIFLIIYFLIIIFYIKILNNFFYINMIKIHLYLNKYEYYQNFYHFVNENDTILSNFFDKIHLYMFKLISPFSDIKLYYRLEYKLNNITQRVTKTELKNKWKDIYKIWYFVNHNKLIKFIVIFICNVFFILKKHCSLYFYHINYNILICIIFYDITQGTIYYTFFMLFIIYINVIIKRIRLFYTTKDIPIDDMLTSYYYKNNTYNNVNNAVLIENSYKNLDVNDFSKITFIFDISDEIISYLKNDLNIQVILYSIYCSNAKLLKKMYIRYHVITLFIIINVYLLYNFDKFNIELIFFSSFCTIILYNIQKQILQNNLELFCEKRFYKIIFYILTILGLMLIYLIFQKNKILGDPTEMIFEYNDIIKIIEKYFNKK